MKLAPEESRIRELHPNKEFRFNKNKLTDDLVKQIFESIETDPKIKERDLKDEDYIQENIDLKFEWYIQQKST